VFQLTHTTEDCAGRWQRIEAARRATWRCSRCGASYRDGVAVRFAVLREYDLELIIFRLVREGRRLLGAPPGRPPRRGP
jgi:PHP family Zn ribbon phosphoesterase